MAGEILEGAGYVLPRLSVGGGLFKPPQYGVSFLPHVFNYSVKVSGNMCSLFQGVLLHFIFQVETSKEGARLKCVASDMGVS